MPALGVCEITRPFLTFFDFATVVLPMEQCAALIFRFAMASSVTVTFGTTHKTFEGAAATRTNTAVTSRSAFIVSVQVPVPEQSPRQPANVEPAFADALSTIDVPTAASALQVEPQLMPPPTTVPPPVPDFVTIRVA